MKKVDPERIVPDTMIPHVAAMHVDISSQLPKNEFGDWVASHEKEIKGMICGMADYKDAPFCPKPRRQFA
jgi:hypothetical protein